jgi:uncharacterized membrane protein
LPFHSLSIYFVSTAGILAALTVILYGLLHWTRPIHAAGSERACELKFRRTVSAILVVTEYYITLEASWIVLVPHRDHLTAVVLLPLVFIFALAAIIALARLGQGGSRDGDRRWVTINQFYRTDRRSYSRSLLEAGHPVLQPR